MKTTYKESELQDLLKDVESQIAAMAKSESALVKAAPGEESDEGSSSDEKSGPPSDSAPADDSASDAAASAPADAAPPTDAPAPDAASAAPPADGSDPAAAGDPAADQSADPAALEAEYAKLPPEDLKAHYLACKSALFAIMGAAAGPDAGAAPAPGADASMAAPPAPPAASPSPAMAPPAPPAASPSAPPTLKSEAEIKIETLTEKLQKSEQSLESLAKIVETIATRPTRKAITSTVGLEKTEKSVDISKLSKSDAKTILRNKVRNGLSKSDQELVLSFDAGTIGMEQVAHLLTK